MRFHLPVVFFLVQRTCFNMNSKLLLDWGNSIDQKEKYIRIESVIMSTGGSIFSCWVCVTPVSTNSSAKKKFNNVN